jgi:multidrug efflux pump subunit AcrA (membrane-fusion protein)
VRRIPFLASIAVAAVVLTACTGEDGPVIETASVTSGEVVQTVAAPAQLDPARRATVTATAGGEIQALLVGDGDVVAVGDPLLRLASDAIEAQIEQASAAVEAADSLAAASAGAGLDLSPVLGAFRSQLDTVFPSLLDTLATQVASAEAGLAAALAGAQEATTAAGELGDAVRDALDQLGGLDPDQLPDGIDPDDLPDGIDPDDLPELPQLVDPDDLPELPDPPDGSAVTEALADAQRTARDARRQLAATQRAFEQASGELAAAERELQAQANDTAAVQAAAVQAQREQAELALAAAEARIDDLTIVAPIAGVVELAPAEASAGGSVGDLSGLGDLAGGLGEGADLGSLLGGGAGGSSASLSGPIAEGVAVGAGQALLTIYDLSGFTARVEIDEIDIVEVAPGQAAVVLVDAFPDAQIAGIVDRVAIAPQRGATGGALYPVTVGLTRIPPDVRLRVGLTASAEIEVRRVTADTVVPTSALLRRGGAEIVFAVRDGIAVEVPVEVTALGDDTAAIEGAIEPGETVVTIGVELVEDGDEVAS